MTDDIAQQLRVQCEDQRALKDMAVEPALYAVRQYSSSCTPLVQVLAQLARYKMDVAHREDQMGREVCAAVEARRATLDVGYDDIKCQHPLLARSVLLNGDTDSDALLGRLASETEAARTRVETASQALPKLEDLAKLPEDKWRPYALARDQALQDQVQLADLRLEGLRAKLHCLQRGLSSSEVALPELPQSSAIESDIPTIRSSTDASPLLATCAELVRSVQEMREVCNREVLAEVTAIAARVAEERGSRRSKLQAELQAVSAQLRAARLAIEPSAELYRRRCRAEALLCSLAQLQPEVREALKKERKLTRDLEDLEDETAPGDPALDRARARLQQVKDHVASLSLRRDGLMAEVVSLSATQGAARCLGQLIEDEAGEAAVQLDFAELPLRAQRIVLPFEAYESMDAAARARFDVQVLLRRSGLLACDRKYASYSELSVIVSSKPNVKRATLRGAARGAAVKILKEYGVDQFKAVKRAVTVAGRLRHPGIVPVECAFLELGGSVVVVQSPFFIGGNMRQWSQDKDSEARLRASQRVAEAVRFLHSHSPPILHRDLKPENVVFDGAGPAARPALCDFDLSISAPHTMTSTLMRGTLLYLSPDPAPSRASDVFSLGMTLLDVLFCDADEDVLRQWVLGSARGVAGSADLARVLQDLERRADDQELAALVRSMVAPEPGARPDASTVADSLGELLDVRTCCVCHCPEPRENGLECPAAERHFVCDDCFSLHIVRLEALCEDGRGGVKCCAGGCGAALSLQEAAGHATKLAFEALCRHVDDLKLVAMQGEFQEWKQQFEQDFAAKSEHERRALAARKHIEEMMALRCPRCRAVFAQFTGCAALTCASAGCNAHFCAFCLVDCGRDAHPHVRACRLNPQQNEYFVAEAVWARIVDGQRREKLEAYWAELDAEVQEALAADTSISQIFRDLKLDRLLGVEAFAEQMAQLRGMGFTDERAMRHALGVQGGDVAAALELLAVE